MTTPVILSLPAVQPVALNPSEDADE
jgi:hypothetical protein